MSFSKGKKDPSELGKQLFYGVGKRRSYVRAFPLLLQAARLNDSHCQNLVGYCYELGLGTEKDLEGAMFWYRKAASYDDKEALGNLALLYEKGKGVKANPRKAFYYNLHLEKPGTYRIWVEYHSPISRAQAKVTPFWSAEDGPIKSNVLQIVVRP